MSSVTVNQDDVDRMIAQFRAAIRAAGAHVLERVTSAAVEHLAKLERDAGREFLAEQWTATPPVPFGDGLIATVFSEAESLTFYNKTSRQDVGRVRGTRHWIKGDSLLGILEGGARAHFILPEVGEFLTIPLPGTEARTSAFVKEHGPGSFLPSEEGDTRFARKVFHPGVQGAHHVEATRQMIEEKLPELAGEAADQIAVELY